MLDVVQDVFGHAMEGSENWDLCQMMQLRFLKEEEEFLSKERARLGSRVGSDKGGDDRTVPYLVDEKSYVNAYYALSSLHMHQPKVVLKLMTQRDQWLRETVSRREMELSPLHVVGVLHTHMGFSEEFLSREINRHAVVRENLLEKNSLSASYLMVMPWADRNLDSIFRFERPDQYVVKKIMHEVGECLSHMHSKGVLHGDLKMLNCVRINHKIRLIDLDSVAAIKDADAGALNSLPVYAGAKFSSGLLPPEMFVSLNPLQQTQYMEYWKDARIAQDGMGSDLWHKVKPIDTGKGVFVVRTFHTQLDGSPHTVGLPYRLQRASAEIDAWSFGVLLFLLTTGGTLLKVC